MGFGLLCKARRLAFGGLEAMAGLEGLEGLGELVCSSCVSGPSSTSTMVTLVWGLKCTWVEVFSPAGSLGRLCFLGPAPRGS